MEKSIFINITAYHDYELPKTIDSLINNSSKKHKLFFGVHYVYEDVDDINLQKYENIKYIASKAPSNLGPGVGRHLANSLYNNEDYYMVIDSHSRVLPNWDDILIQDILMYQDLGYKKPVLTSYPASYYYDEEGKEMFGPNSGPQNIDFNKEDYFQNLFKEKLNVQNIGCDKDSKYQKSVSGGFTFTVTPYIDLNKYISFKEEFAVAAILYTNGFDLLIPTQLVLYHYYSKPGKNVWVYKDNLKVLDLSMQVSESINYDMFSNNIIGKGYLGKERSLQEYFDFAEIDFKNRMLL